ncbi:MAG: DNA polymerase Y family protein [Acidimicrobiales bacterium]
MRAPRLVVLWCPDWPVVAAGREGGGSAAPLAVLDHGRVLACSSVARTAGVRRGLRRRQAEGRCPGLVVVAHDPGRDTRAFEPLVAALEATVSPSVEILRPGLCALASRGPSRRLGGDAALAEEVRRVASAALAAGPALATDPAFATDLRVGVADGRLAASQAARRGPGGVVVPPGQSAAFLAPLPVSTVAADVVGRPDLADLLRRLGIRTLGELAALPAASVLARFGSDGLVAHRLACGLDEVPLSARPVPPDMDVTLELDPPAERIETVAFAARALAVELCEAMAARGLACTCVRVVAETGHGDRVTRSWRQDSGGRAGAAALAERVRWQLEGWLTARARPGEGDPDTSAHAPTGGITRLTLVPEEVRADLGRQLGFWGGDRAVQDRAARALARVQGMLGPEAVVTATLAGGRRVGDQARLVAWGEAPPPTRAAEGPSWPGRVPPPAPAVLHAPLLAAEVVDADGTVVALSGRGVATAGPARLSVAGGPWCEVVAWAGPWPLDERWWDPLGRHRRAHWQVLTADGVARLLVLEAGRWWIEATYD